ncbi:MAG: hypothetical protein DWQ51_20035 [Microcystis wesenbergii TW10]|jgi:hypothetical protein|uniref:Uncharacterized protein n=4 Tax=Microcystis TaxID=1125 RepID=A0A0A1VWQ3_MICAE|nr:MULTISPECIES: hypothetical protein [Microcystis]MCZ8096927.1 hypothetical protein [Burkholderiales bacterium]REJ47717.1 MAG: hypothetical protein DWQ51_20035 [Microcystis wesenbergii TW10]TRT84578.1 MAG: hypothetical protein EWV63_14990 [Microcystis aeruginosa Ma_OC_H_19870700_S124]MBD2119002.1 hypothetical protein [Microcystis wesenbergii FACHB-1339]MCZ8036927.1 hypothetical protein [Microcystis sp. LE17-20A]
MSASRHYHQFSQGISVVQEFHDQQGDWYPPIIVPYFWQDGVLWVCCSRQELGYEKACPVNTAKKWLDHTDFFILNGVMLFGYPKNNGYMPVYLESLQGKDAILF